MVESGRVFEAKPNPNIDIVQTKPKVKSKPKVQSKPKPAPKKVVKPQPNLNYETSDDDNGVASFFKSIFWIIVFFSVLQFLGA